MYGELVIEHYGWGYDGEFGSRETVLDYHYCSDEELGLVRGPDTTIYPFFQDSIEEVMAYRKKFKCARKEDLEIWGDFNSRQAQ